jgi:hypothetical protein
VDDIKGGVHIMTMNMLSIDCSESSVSRRISCNSCSHQRTDDDQNDQSDGIFSDHQQLNHLSLSSPSSILVDERIHLSVNGHERTRDRWIRRLVALALLSSLTFVIVDSFGDRKVEAMLWNFLSWVQRYPYRGAVAVTACYIIATVLFIPGSILTLGAGFAIGSAFDNTAMGVLLSTCVRLLNGGMCPIFVP